MTVSSGTRSADLLEGGRGERTRSAILAASRQLFLDRGYAGTPINAITEACGISRAGFYTYFKDKREIFNVLGETAYHEVLAVTAELERLPRDYGLDELRSWVGDYFAYLDCHGAFVMAARHSAPDDEAFRQSRDRTISRASWRLGQAIARDGRHSPEVIGVTVTGMLERAWHAVQTQSVRVDQQEVVDVVAEMISAMRR